MGSSPRIPLVPGVRLVVQVHARPSNAAAGFWDESSGTGGSCHSSAGFAIRPQVQDSHWLRAAGTSLEL